MEQNFLDFFNRSGTRITLKLALIFFLVIILLIPRAMIMELVTERKSLSNSVTREVSDGWGGDQTFTGPVLVIPYEKWTDQEDKSRPKIMTKQELIIFPDSTDMTGTLDTETKHRSIYDVLLYRTSVDCSGTFTLPDPAVTKIQPSNLLTDEAYVVMGLSDVRGISEKIRFSWEENPITFSPGMENISFNFLSKSQAGTADSQPAAAKNISSGLKSPVVLSLDKKTYRFAGNINFRGSGSLNFAPLARTTTVTVSSSHPDPVFSGSFLPEHKVSSSGFNATWKVLEYNRSIPEFTTEQQTVTVSDATFGVTVKNILDHYSKTERSGKYMILFIGLTFLVVLITETVLKIRVHIFQYLLIGIALAVFFTLLLSISEFLGFDKAYLIAASATVLQIFLYSLGMFKNRKSSLLLLALLVSLFAYIYQLIRLENTALLAGSVGLFVIVTATMYITRKVRWLESGSGEVEP